MGGRPQAVNWRIRPGAAGRAAPRGLPSPRPQAADRPTGQSGGPSTGEGHRSLPAPKGTPRGTPRASRVRRAPTGHLPTGDVRGRLPANWPIRPRMCPPGEGGPRRGRPAPGRRGIPLRGGPVRRGPPVNWPICPGTAGRCVVPGGSSLPVILAKSAAGRPSTGESAVPWPRGAPSPPKGAPPRAPSRMRPPPTARRCRIR